MPALVMVAILSFIVTVVGGGILAGLTNLPIAVTVILLVVLKLFSLRTRQGPKSNAAGAVIGVSVALALYGACLGMVAGEQFGG
jgi:hypothetical protein